MKPRRLDLPWMTAGFQKAPSSNTGGRRIADAGVLAAHDAGEAERLLLVGDEQQIGLEVERLLVQERKLFAGARAKRTTIGAFEQSIVVRRAAAVPARASRSW